MSNNFIVNTPLDKLRIVSFQGMTIYNCHKQIQEVLKKQLKEENANVFAEPVFDETDGSIDWYTNLNGKARPYASLSAEEQTELKGKFQALTGEIANLAKGILADSKEGSSVKGNILQKALVWPLAPEPDACLYAVGNQPVLICWGFMDGAGKTVSKEDIDRDEAGKKQARVTEFVQKAVPAAAAVPPPAADQVPPAVEPEKPVEEKKEERKRGWVFPWWLLFLLLLLLLFLFFYYFLLPRYPGFFSGSGFGCSRGTPVAVAPASPGFGCSRSVPVTDGGGINIQKPEVPVVVTTPPVTTVLPSIVLPWTKGRLYVDGNFVDEANEPVTLVVKGSVEDLQKGRLFGEIKGKRQVCEGEGKFSIAADSGYELNFTEGLACPNKNDFDPFRLYCDSMVQECYLFGKNDEKWPVRVKLEF